MVKKAGGSMSDFDDTDMSKDPESMKLNANCIFDVDEAIKLLNNEPSIALDLETTGLRPWKDKIAVIALYGPICKKAAILHRKPGTEYPPHLFEWLAAPMPDGSIREYVTHNGTNFDIPYLHAAGMDVSAVNWWDTLISEQVTVVSGRKNIRFSLKETQRRRLGRASKKEISHESWQNKELNQEQIDYVLADIQELHQIKKHQLKTCESDRKMIDHDTGKPLYKKTRADHLALEMDLLPIVVQMTCNGVPIQVDKLREFVAEQQEVATTQSEIIREKLGDINIGSPAQLKKALLNYGIFIENIQAQTILDLSYEYEGQELGDVCRAITLFKHAQQRVNMFSKKYEQDYIVWRPDRNFHFVHPRFRQLGTDTGRLSSSEPNLQQIPKTKNESLGEVGMRHIFGGLPQHKVVSIDYCLHPTTLVETTKGKRPISHIVPGDTVYSYDSGSIVGSKVVRSTPVQALPAYCITFDNGESVIASSDHRWPTKQRGHGTHVIKRTDELVVGQRMIPMRRTVTGKGYVSLYSDSYFQYTKEHELVAEVEHGPRSDGYEVHHKDGNKENNLPENLEYRTVHDHRSEHAQKNYALQDHQYRITKLREGLKNRRSYTGQGNPNYGKGLATPFTCLLCGNIRILPPSRNMKYCSSACYQQARSVGLNHTITSIEYIGVQPMHAIEVENTHNYVLAAGVVTLNSQIEVRVAAIYGKDLNLIRALKEYDIHSYVAKNLFKLPDDVTTPEYWKTKEGKRQRQAAKAATFCLIFGGSPPALQSYAKQYGVNMTLNEAGYIHYNFFELFPGLKMFRDESKILARKRSHTIELPTGLRRNLIRIDDNINSDEKDGDPLTPQRIMNTQIQGTAAIGLKAGLLELATRPYKDGSLADLLVATIHDEILAVVPEDDAEVVAPQMQDALVVGMHKIVNQGKYKVPIVAEVTIGDTWAG